MSAGGRNPRSGGYRWYGLAEGLSRHPDLSDRAKLAAWQLAACADNGTGEVTLSRARLAERLGMTGSADARLKAAQRAIGELRRVRALVLVKSGRGGRGRTDAAAVYRLSEEALAAVPALTERGDSTVPGFDVKGGQREPKRGDSRVPLPTHSPSSRGGKGGQARFRKGGHRAAEDRIERQAEETRRKMAEAE